MQEFITAAKGFTPEEGETFDFVIDGREVSMYHPGSGQAAIMTTMSRGEMKVDSISTFLTLFFNLFDHDDAIYFQDRLMDRNDPFEIDSEGGVLDIFEALMDEISAKRPPVEPTDYQPKRRATGRGSTANTRAKASTSSPSRSRASSRSSKSGS